MRDRAAMYRGLRVAVVVPAFREERLIGATLAAVPDYVDRVYFVDDASPDGTWAAASASADARVCRIRHALNRGVGAAIATGYYRALADGVDAIAVMAGDRQMDPVDLPALLDPVAAGAADYVKGNRFRHPEWRTMPTLRRLAGKCLATATRLATGYAVDDTQCGYTVIAAGAAERLPLDELWPRYGYPNDLLGMMAALGLRVIDVPVRPVYAGEHSGLRPWHPVLILGLIGRRWAVARPARSDLEDRQPEEPAARWTRAPQAMDARD